MSVVIIFVYPSPLFSFCTILVPTDIFDRDAIPFLDLQGFSGLSELPREQDAFSEPIFIPRGMIIDDRVVTSVYVSF